MILPKFGRSKMMQGVSVLGFLALATIGYTGLRPEVEPEAMRNKSIADLEAILDPLAEDIVSDETRRAMSEYRASKGFLSCDGECEHAKRRYLQSAEEKQVILVQKAAARMALRIRLRAQIMADRRSSVRIHAAELQAERQSQRLATSQAAAFAVLTANERQNARFGAREEANTFHRLSHLTPGERQAARKEERAAEAAAHREANKIAHMNPGEKAQYRMQVRENDRNGILNPVCVPDPSNCSCEPSEEDYRGAISTTVSGRTCQRWNSQVPHEHTNSAALNVGEGLVANFCRNPDGEDGAWCYTMDEEVRWELCGIPTCPTDVEIAAAEAAAAAEVAEAAAAAAAATITATTVTPTTAAAE